MDVFRFREFGLNKPIHALKLGVFGVFDPSNVKNSPKSTSLRETASFESSCVKIRRLV